jgi:hypothetical protein
MIYYSIETIYKGLKFRSRLEAHWAAFFDLLGWEWAYEAIDLKGYIPDFILNFNRPMLVEIKSDFNLVGLYKYCKKIENSGWNDEYMVFGAILHNIDNLGLLIERNEERLGLPKPYRDYKGSLFAWDLAKLSFCKMCNGITVISENGWWQCRKCGAYDGDNHLGNLDYKNISILDFWNKAQNIVRYSGNGIFSAS